MHVAYDADLVMGGGLQTALVRCIKIISCLHFTLQRMSTYTFCSEYSQCVSCFLFVINVKSTTERDSKRDAGGRNVRAYVGDSAREKL